MKYSLPTVAGLCLCSFSYHGHATVNVQGTYSGTISTINTDCRQPEFNGSWSAPVSINIKQNREKFNSLPFSITDTLTGITARYSVETAEANRNKTEADISGTISADYNNGTISTSRFTGTAGTDFANASFTFSRGAEASPDGCTKSSHFSLTKTIGPRSVQNNTASDAVHQAFASGDSVLQASNQQTNNVKTRINTLKHRSSRPAGRKTVANNGFLDTSQLTLTIDGDSLSIGRLQNMLDHELSSGGASGDDIAAFDTGFGIFINGNVDFGDRKSSVNQQGYDNDGAGVTIGADYRFTDNFFTGLALGYNSSDTDYEGRRGNLSSDTYSASLYTSYNRPGGYFIDAVIRYGYSTFKGERNFNVNNSDDPSNFQAKALSNYNANDYSINIETGYEFIFYGISLQPYVGANITYAEMNSYEETAGSANTSGLLFGIEKQRAYSAQTTLGADLSYVFTTDYAVLIPRFNFEWHHEFLEDYPRIIDSFTLGLKNTTTATTFSDTPDADYFSIGGGLSAALPYGISSFVNYNTIISTKFLTSHNINFGLRWNF